MDENLRSQIIIAAITAVGPVEDKASWQDRVIEKAAEITALINEKSLVAKTVDSVAVSKVFSAEVTGLTYEKSSTRGIVSLKTQPSKFHEDGIETARTERTDNPMGVAMGKRLKALIGHRVMIWVEVEEISGGAGKVRIVRHVQDLGEVESNS